MFKNLLNFVFLFLSTFNDNKIPNISRVVENSNFIVFSVQQNSMYSNTLLSVLKEKYPNYKFEISKVGESDNRSSLFLEKIKTSNRNDKIIFWYEKEENLESLEDSELSIENMGILYADNYFVLNVDKLDLVKSRYEKSFSLKLIGLGTPVRLKNDFYMFPSLKEEVK